MSHSALQHAPPSSKKMAFYIGHELRQDPDVTYTVECLNVSNNHFGDEDMTYIEEAVETTVELAASPELVVILSNTRIHGKISTARDTIQRFLEHDRVRFLDISTTPLACIDNASFFQELPEPSLRKLVFIPPFRNMTMGLRALLESEEKRKISKQTHEEYWSCQPLYADRRASAKGFVQARERLQQAPKTVLTLSLRELRIKRAQMTVE
eukprot:TRINITY_DN11474_c0_g2_i1.p1 TRINITY_DN11474_c0_g2~~TRINITY_DN11474_c0_g2_i1.p1  ORF type:complete len:210 (+),score=26.98 TRINITY_DN11474_c0_g2_i1:433-1062(+)